MNEQENPDCVWYLAGLNQDSTTFEKIRKLPYEEAKDMKLYKCTQCDGYKPGCDNYVGFNEPSIKNGWRSIVGMGDLEDRIQKKGDK